MSIVAIVPVASLRTVNALLEEEGFGPGSFSVPAYGATGATHAGLHAWDDPAFLAALQAIPEVVIDDGKPVEGEPVLGHIERTNALIAAQGAKWGGQAAAYAGALVAGKLYRYSDNSLWWCIQPYSTVTFPLHPSTYAALIKRARQPGAFEPWAQPQGAHDSYRLLDLFTGQPEVCSYGGKRWKTKVDNNVWQPAARALWVEVI